MREAARNMLSMQATSVESERTFSVGGRMGGKDRGGLKPSMLAMLVASHTWRRTAAKEAAEKKAAYWCGGWCGRGRRRHVRHR